MNDLINLERLKTLMMADAPLPDDLRWWFINGVNRFQEGECKNLCIALGLRSKGISSTRTQKNIIKRNEIIRYIAAQYEGINWQKAVIINKNIKRYPRIPEKTLYSLLFNLEEEVKIPKSDTAIYNILNSK